MQLMRNIQLEMVQYLDTRLETNGLASYAIAHGDARMLMRLAAQACVGIRELGGNNTGPMVTLIQETVGGPDHVAWCMSFVQTCIAYAELKTGAKSPIAASEHCLTVWAATPKEQRVKTFPRPGAIPIWQHGTSSSGHTGVVDSCGLKTFFSFEGNTDAGVDPKGGIQRDGGGVYHVNRSLTPAGKMKLLGFLKPF